MIIELKGQISLNEKKNKLEITKGKGLKGFSQYFVVVVFIPLDLTAPELKNFKQKENDRS